MRIPADGNQPVFIAQSRSIAYAQNFQEPVAIVIPDTNNWNDFGRGYFAKLLLIGEAFEETEFHLRIMFDGYDRSETALKELIKKHGEIFPIDEVSIPFVSLLPEEELYGQFIRALNFDMGVAALRRLNDAVVLRFEKTNQPLIELTYGEEFAIGVLRYGGAYSAIRRGARHFTGGELPDIDDSAQNFVFQTKLRNSENEVRVDFRFKGTPIFRDRIAVLVGQNGSGKTQFLRAMISGLIAETQDDLDGYSPRFQPAVKFHRTLVFSSVPTDPYPKVIGAWEGVDYDYFALNTARNDKSDSLLEALVALKFENEKVKFGETNETRRLDILTGILEDLGLEGLSLPLRERRDDDDLPRVIQIQGQSYLPIDTNFNEQNGLKAYQQINWSGVPIVIIEGENTRDLSSGELAMLRFATQAIAAIETGSLLLFDEPETHLHPKYISQLVDILYSLLKATKSIAIIATHSAYVVREVSRDNVKVLTIEGGELSFSTPRMQTFGASIDTISQFAFGDTK